MDFYVIPPNSELQLMHKAKGNRYFCLAQIYHTNEKYREFFKQQKANGSWITLDNGAGDHDMITEDILFECMLDLMPNEVIPPDTLYDMKTTIKSLESFVKLMNENNLLDKIEIFAVPQGKDKYEWLDCYQYMLNHKNVTTIGMSKLAIPHAWLGEAKDDKGIQLARWQCVDTLIEMDLIKKPLHFLGGETGEEYIKYIQLNNELFRSTDSCFTVLAGINYQDISSRDYKRKPTPRNYFDLTMNSEQVELAIKNIKYMDNIFNTFNIKQ